MSTNTITPEQVCKYKNKPCKHAQCYDNLQGIYFIPPPNKEADTPKSSPEPKTKTTKEKGISKSPKKKRVLDLPRPPSWAVEHKPGSKPYKKKIAKNGKKLLRLFDTYITDGAEKRFPVIG